MHHPTDRIAHTTAFDTPVVGHWLEREINVTKAVICDCGDMCIYFDINPMYSVAFVV